MENEWRDYLDDFVTNFEELVEAKIWDIKAYIGTAKYIRKFVIATGEFDVARNLIVVIRLNDQEGIGEAPINGVETKELKEGLTTFKGKFLGKTLNDYINFIKDSKLQNWLGLSVEMALLDAITKSLNKRYGDLFSKSYINAIESDITIGIMSLSETIDTFKKFLELGFKKIKLKVGLDLKEDLEKLEALFDNAPEEVWFRIDANQGYSKDEALELINFLEKKAARIELLEQPLKKDELEAINELREKTDIPIIVDESVRTKENVEKVAKFVDGVNLKPIKSGGVLELSYSYLLAKELALLTMIGCNSESNIGITSSTYIASTHNVDFVDLDSDILQEPLTKKIVTIYQGGYRILPTENGLGLEPKDLIESKIERIF